MQTKIGRKWQWIVWNWKKKFWEAYIQLWEETWCRRGMGEIIFLFIKSTEYFQLCMEIMSEIMDLSHLLIIKEDCIPKIVVHATLKCWELFPIKIDLCWKFSVLVYDEPIKFLRSQSSSSTIFNKRKLVSVIQQQY